MSTSRIPWCAIAVAVALPAGAHAQRGPFTFASSGFGFERDLIQRWHALHPTEQVNLVPWQSRGRATWCVGAVEPTDVAALAASGTIRPIPAGTLEESDYFAPAVEAGKIGDQLFAAPWILDVGLLFYRAGENPQCAASPTSWADIECVCGGFGDGCFGGQIAPYEGLTVNFVELVAAEGGSILSPDGDTVTLDGAVAAAGRLQTSFSRASVDEESTRALFQAGALHFARNWPYMYYIGPDGLYPEPQFQATTVIGGRGALGGHALALGTTCANPQSADDFLAFLLGEQEQRFVAMNNFAPAYAAGYDVATNSGGAYGELYRFFPQFKPIVPTMYAALVDAVARPKTPRYAAVSAAIQTALRAMLDDTTGEVTPAVAIDRMRSDLEAILQP